MINLRELLLKLKQPGKIKVKYFNTKEQDNFETATLYKEKNYKNSFVYDLETMEYKTDNEYNVLSIYYEDGTFIVEAYKEVN